ncbi:MAG: L,D-transpeptidase family protein, partial [Hyphomicrobiaceae bacterium]|nr:L,D-transpeptidase family protein [Hyphomicrobiaceae bacterium]
SPVLAALTQRLGDKKIGLSADERKAVAAFYERRGSPLWTNAQGLSETGSAVLAELRRAEDYGLPVKDIVASDVLTAIQTTRAASDAAPSPSALAETEIKITSAVLDYARFARGGRIPEPSKQLATYIDRAPQFLKAAQVVDRVMGASDPSDGLRKLNPQHPEFEALRRAYVEQRSKSEVDAAVTIPAGPSLRPGDRHPHVVIARRLMKLEAPDANLADVYDTAMAERVRAFQASRDLTPADGIIGRKTREAINAIAEERGPSARDLLVNMEQWRWMPEDLGAMRIEVNVPEFMIRLVRNGQTLFSERVVAGQIDKQTPLFSDRLQTIVMRPDWILPESVKVRDAIPSLLGRGDFFYSYGLKVRRGETEVDPRAVDWYSADQRAYTFYQPPGEKNALGQVKFLFPNKHAVYFHDTPTKQLFDKRERAFSRGCVRVRDPVRLAELVLASDRGWTAENVRALVDDGPEDNRVTLNTPVPIHITYFTVTSGEDGKLKRHRDLYGHAKRISLALDGRWKDIDIPEDHLAPIEDREFEWRVSAAAERRREAEYHRYRYQTNPMDNFFRSIFGP